MKHSEPKGVIKKGNERFKKCETKDSSGAKASRKAIGHVVTSLM